MLSDCVGQILPNFVDIINGAQNKTREFFECPIFLYLVRITLSDKKNFVWLGELYLVRGTLSG